MSNLFPRIFNANHLEPAHKNKIELDKIYCPFHRRDNASHRARRFTKTSSLVHHIHQEHNDEPDLDFVLEILKHVSFASQLRII